MQIWPFRPSQAESDAERLLAIVVALSRRPAFFGENRVPDTLQGRFEILTLHAGLALIRLRSEANAGRLAQAFTDRLFRRIDAGLREAGVGDLTVPKRMRRLAGDFYGRLEAYGEALAAGSGLTAAIARNVFGAGEHAFAAGLASYVRETASQHAAAPAAALLDQAGWPTLAH